MDQLWQRYNAPPEPFSPGRLLLSSLPSTPVQSSHREAFAPPATPEAWMSFFSSQGASSTEQTVEATRLVTPSLPPLASPAFLASGNLSYEPPAPEVPPSDLRPPGTMAPLEATRLDVLSVVDGHLVSVHHSLVDNQLLISLADDAPDMRASRPPMWFDASRCTGLLSVSPLALYWASVETDEGPDARRLRLTIDLHVSQQRITVQRLNDAIASVRGKDVAASIYGLAQVSLAERLGRASVSAAALDSSALIAEIKAELMRRDDPELVFGTIGFLEGTTAGEIAYLCRYLDNPRAFLQNTQHSAMHRNLVQCLVEHRHIVDLAMQGVLSVREVRRWLADERRSNTSLSPRARSDEEREMDTQLVRMAIEQSNAGGWLGLARTATDRDWQLARSFYDLCRRSYEVSFETLKIPSEVLAAFSAQPQICLLKESGVITIDASGVCTSSRGEADREEISRITNLIAQPRPHQVPVQEEIISVLPQLDSETVDAVLRRLCYSRCLVLPNTLGLRDSLVEQIDSLSRYVLSPQNVHACLAQIAEHGGLVPRERSLPMLFVRSVHLLQARELRAVLCAVYSRAARELSLTDESDLDAVPMLVYEGDDLGASDLMSIVTTNVTPQSMHRWQPPAPGTLPPPLANAPQDDPRLPFAREVFSTETRPVARLARAMYLELARPEGGALRCVPNANPEQFCVVSNESNDLLAMRANRDKPLCLRASVYTQLPSAKEMYRYWTCAPRHVLYLEGADVDTVVSNSFLRRARDRPAV